MLINLSMLYISNTDMLSYRRFLILGGAVTFAGGAALGYGIATGSQMLVLLAFGTALVLVHLLRRRVDELVVDERLARAGEAASHRVLQLAVPAAALAGVLLVSAGRSEGMLLVLVSTAFMLLYAALFAWYSRRDSLAY